MNKKNIKYIVTSLVMINCLALASKSASAYTYFSYSNFENQISYAHKDGKSKGFDIFNEKNHKYLSAEQKKELQEIKKCKDKGETLSEDQKKTLHSLIDCIIKGRLGDKKYADFKCLMDKKRSNTNLTEEETKRLDEYNDIIDGTKPTGTDILEQFLR
ncbi:hypothetical protein CDLVIII_4856 [Clostridium sp. DL-VIII]|uniref:hypothetical protein n=1 Tax=Clostridium sp. DL-VIII TaxID=641107 RepID=UPI00023B046E|nr:hypothetical protein [Clostridium sp. DL-VIII]EHJ01349.1 hypothetical protein CDLVIII_4856 [Clostridium sp. DL-VIII]